MLPTFPRRYFFFSFLFFPPKSIPTFFLYLFYFFILPSLLPSLSPFFPSLPSTYPSPFSLIPHTLLPSFLLSITTFPFLISLCLPSLSPSLFHLFISSTFPPLQQLSHFPTFFFLSFALPHTPAKNISVTLLGSRKAICELRCHCDFSVLRCCDIERRKFTRKLTARQTLVWCRIIVLRLGRVVHGGGYTVMPTSYLEMRVFLRLHVHLTGDYASVSQNLFRFPWLMRIRKMFVLNNSHVFPVVSLDIILTNESFWSLPLLHLETLWTAGWSTFLLQMRMARKLELSDSPLLAPGHIQKWVTLLPPMHPSVDCLQSNRLFDLLISYENREEVIL